MQIQPVNTIAPASHIGQVTAETNGPPATSFGATFAAVLQEGNQAMLNADQTLTDFSEGKIDDIHSVVVATVEADLSFRFFLEMRNRLTAAYQEVSRMQF